MASDDLTTDVQQQAIAEEDGQVAPKPKDELADKIIAMEKLQHKARANYAAADELAEEIIPLLKKRKKVRISDGRVARLKDNFARRNKAFKQCGVNRFEVEILSE